MKLEEEIGALLRARKLTLGAVESATGGLISHLITNVPGSSDYYRGSVTSYSNEIKLRIIGVRESTLRVHGAVSKQVAREMAAGGQKLLNVDICIADTGIAGPGGATFDKPVGLFFLALANHKNVVIRNHVFNGNREENKEAAAQAALQMVKDYLLSV